MTFRPEWDSGFDEAKEYIRDYWLDKIDAAISEKDAEIERLEKAKAEKDAEIAEWMRKFGSLLRWGSVR